MVAMMPLPNKTPGYERVAMRFARSRYVYNYRGRCVLLELEIWIQSLVS